MCNITAVMSHGNKKKCKAKGNSNKCKEFCINNDSEF